MRSTNASKIQKLDDCPKNKRDGIDAWHLPRAMAIQDWDVFKQVINGNGPCNKERLAVRRMAEEKGRWVRRAILQKDAEYVAPLS